MAFLGDVVVAATTCLFLFGTTILASSSSTLVFVVVIFSSSSTFDTVGRNNLGGGNGRGKGDVGTTVVAGFKRSL